MISYNPSKFPAIVIDKTTNYPNGKGTKKSLTIEEYQDLMHHTHKVTDLVDADGNPVDPSTFNGGGSSTTVITKKEYTELKETVETQKTTIQTMQTQITELQNKITAIESDNAKAKESSFIIGDYDVTKEGKQDSLGNTIG